MNDLIRHFTHRAILFFILNLLTVASFSYLFWVAAFGSHP